MIKTLLSHLFLIYIILFSSNAFAEIDDDQLGGWYMYFWSLPGGSNDTQGRFGLQGDIQYRNWNVIGDLEQLLLRGGITYRP